MLSMGLRADELINFKVSIWTYFQNCWIKCIA